MKYNNLVIEAKDFAIKAHEGVNQKYMGVPYAFHLRMASNVANRYINGYPEDGYDQALVAAVWLHDTLEDCHNVSYNDLKKRFGVAVADLVYAVTDKKGRTRKERKDFQSIRDTKGATFVKLADRISNCEAGLIFGGDMLQKYREEQSEFNYELYPKTEDKVVERMFYDLELLLQENSELFKHYSPKF